MDWIDFDTCISLEETCWDIIVVCIVAKFID